MAVPLNFLIEFAIRSKILEGRLLPGEKMPCERDLAKQFDVSVITVRSAISKLENDGLIIRKAGKGTFVREDIDIKDPLMLTLEMTGSNIQHLFKESGKYRVDVLGMEEREIGETKIAQELARFFGKSNRDHITVLRRVRVVGNTPVQYVENFILPDIAKHLTMEDLSRETLQKILKKKIDLKIGMNETYIQSVPADNEIAGIFNCHVFIPLLLFQSFFWFANGEPFEIVNLLGNPPYLRYCLRSGDVKTHHGNGAIV
jgi:GntR family transcriptional regulator